MLLFALNILTLFIVQEHQLYLIQSIHAAIIY